MKGGRLGKREVHHLHVHDGTEGQGCVGLAPPTPAHPPQRHTTAPDLGGGPQIEDARSTGGRQWTSPDDELNPHPRTRHTTFGSATTAREIPSSTPPISRHTSKLCMTWTPKPLAPSV